MHSKALVAPLRLILNAARDLQTGDGYTLVIEPPLADFPSTDATADAARMNAVIESQVLRQPRQYFWLHKRFNSRPEGEADFYRGGPDRP